jgi:hypothetical protein
VVVLWTTPAGAVRPVETFEIANRVGEPTERCFYLFSTSVGSYVIRQDGMGEVSIKGLRRVFHLKLGAKGYIERIHFLEHEGDLFLFYEVRDASSEWAFVMRMEQRKRKFRWLTAVASVGEPKIEGQVVMIDATQINKADGKTVAN